MKNYYCGIDIGKSGYAAILDESVKLVALIHLGRVQDGRDSEKDFVDPMNLVLSIEKAIPGRRSIFFFIEDQFRNKSTLIDLGSILASCIIFKQRNVDSLNHDIARVPARSWMSAMSVTSNKKEHIAVARQYFPESVLSTMTHDQADALCIALYGMQKKIGDILFDKSETVIEEEE